ncbi:MAG: single-stranded DNA-binding protein [Patescibacteria group bacterium]
MDLNRATIIGRLTRDPEVRSTPSGRSVATIGMATNRAVTDQQGNKKEYVEYHNCVLWGKLAEIAGQYLTKGRRAYMEGRLQTRDWVGTDGVKRYKTEIVVDNMIMLDGPRGGHAAPAMAGSNDAPSPAFEPSAGEEQEIKVEDIPF